MENKGRKKKNGNGLNGSHTDLLSLTTICSHTAISSQKNKKNTNKKCFQVSSFHPPHFLSVITDLFRVEKEQEIQKNKDWGLEGVKGYSSSLSFLMCKSI